MSTSSIGLGGLLICETLVLVFWARKHLGAEWDLGSLSLEQFRVLQGRTAFLLLLINAWAFV